MYLTDMTTEQLSGYLQGEQGYRAVQAREWILRGVEPGGMTNLPASIRGKLSLIPWGGAVIEREYVSGADDTKKYLFRLDDGELVEGVLMRYRHGNTLCLSTQIGCRMGCAFCASTMEGLIRNLRRGEMLSMLLAVEKSEQPKGSRAVTNIVLMGSGEPLDNYDEVVAFLHVAVSELLISPRNISLSTCGIVPKILRFIGEAPHVTLCVSLHAPNDEIRRGIMPIKYSISEILGAAKQYSTKTGRRVIIEYALIKGVNAGKEHADELSDILRPLNCHVNLIPLNSVSGRELKGVTREEAAEFAARLKKRKISATLRREMGADIQGACGQLRRKVNEETY